MYAGIDVKLFENFTGTAETLSDAIPTIVAGLFFDGVTLLLYIIVV